MSNQEWPAATKGGCCAPALTAPLDSDTAGKLAGMFKAMGDPVRLRLLSLIAAAGGNQVCVCELTPQFGLAQPTISHHLKVLRESGLIDSQRRGTWVYYWVIPEVLQQLSAVLDLSSMQEETV